MENKKLDYKKNKGDKTVSELQSAFYAEGNLDLVFLINIPNKYSGDAFIDKKVKSVSFGDVFAIDHVDLDYRHRTLFVKDWYVYTINRNYIKPRWCELNWKLSTTWDISKDGTMITIAVGEFDEKGDHELRYITKRQWTNNFKIDGGVEGIPLGGKAQAKINVGYSGTDTHDTNVEEKFTRSQGGIDDLGTAYWEYITPIVEKRVNKNGKWGYEINTITTGTIDIMVLPVSY